MSTITRVSELFDIYLKAEDLEKPVNVTIAKCTVEEIFNPRAMQTEQKAVLDFGRSKSLILNKTQCMSLWEITGSEVFADWSGIKITLSHAKASNGKDTIAITRATAAPMERTNGDKRNIDIDALR